MTSFNTPIYDLYTKYVYSHLTVYEDSYRSHFDGLKPNDISRDSLSSKLKGLKSDPGLHYLDGNIRQSTVYRKTAAFFDALDYTSDYLNDLPDLTSIYKEISAVVLSLSEGKISLFMDNCFSETITLYDRIYSCLNFYLEERYQIELDKIYLKSNTRYFSTEGYYIESYEIEEKIKKLYQIFYYIITVHKLLKIIEEPFIPKKSAPVDLNEQESKSELDISTGSGLKHNELMILLNELGFFDLEFVKSLPKTSQAKLVSKLIGKNESNIRKSLTYLDKNGTNRSENPYHGPSGSQYKKNISKLLNNI